MATSKTTTKKTTVKKTTAKKTTTKKVATKDTGAMDEFLDTVVGETIQEDDIVTKQPKKIADAPGIIGSSSTTCTTIVDASLIEIPICKENETCIIDNLEKLTEFKVNRITAVTDDGGNVLYYKVPCECEELQNLENNDEIKKQLAKIIADDIYKKFNEEMTEKQEPVEVKPVDITPEVVAPKQVFPFRVVERW